jgi:hypothetical protein
MRQSDTHRPNKAQRKRIFWAIDGLLFERLNRLISSRGQSKVADGDDRSGEMTSLAIPTLQDMLHRHS